MLQRVRVRWGILIRVSGTYVHYPRYEVLLAYGSLPMAIVFFGAQKVSYNYTDGVNFPYHCKKAVVYYTPQIAALLVTIFLQKFLIFYVHESFKKTYEIEQLPTKPRQHGTQQKKLYRWLTLIN